MDGQQSGLIVMGWDYCYLGVEKEGDKFILKQVTCKDAEQKIPETVTRLQNYLPAESTKQVCFPTTKEISIYG